MNYVNLIPAPRRQAKACRSRLVRWAIVLGVYAGVLVAGHFVCDSRWSADGGALASEIRASAAQLGATNSLMLSIHGELVETEEKLRSARAVGRQPDWGVLLALLAKNVRSEVVLELCRLRPVDGARGGRGGGSSGKGEADGVVGRLDRPLLLELSGLATSQAAVSRFVLRLEKTGLFEQVRLVSTNQRSFQKRNVVSFRLEGLLAGRDGGAL